MKTSDSIAKLSGDFVKAQAELKNAVFDKTNPHFKSKYATLNAVRDAIVPVLAKNNLAVMQGTTAVGDAWAVSTRLVHTSGEWIESHYPFAIDKPQQMGSAYSYARRYSLAAICGIASEEDDDANTAQNSNEPPARLVPVAFDKSKTETRDDFKRLCADMNRSTTLKALNEWYADNAKEIAGLNTDLQENLRNSYIDKQRELKGLAA